MWRRLSLLFALLAGVVAPAVAQTVVDLFNDAFLHEVRIAMKPQDWQSLKDHFRENINFNVDSFTWTGGGGLTSSVTQLNMNSRGNGSRYMFKPSLEISFNGLVKNQTFLGLSNVVLKANSQDPSQLHEILSMKLFTRMGTAAPREAYTKLYVNDEYIGLYLLVEHLDGDLAQHVWGESKGYMYEYAPFDWAGVGLGYHFEYRGPDPESYASATADVPYQAKTHKNAPDGVTLEGFTRTLNQSADADFEAQMAPYLDVDLWLRHIAVESFVSDFDCILGGLYGMNNFAVYRFADKPLLEFVAWDKDNAFDWVERPVLYGANDNLLMRRLMTFPAHRASYFESVTQAGVLAGGNTGWMYNEATRFYNLIHDAAYADPNKTTLNTGAIVPITNDDFENAVAFVKTLPGQRAVFLARDVAANGYDYPPTLPAITLGGFAADGGLASIYGAGLGSSSDTTAIYINGYLAPTKFVSDGQVNVQIPAEVGTGTVIVAAIVNGRTSNVLTSTIAPAQ